MTLSGVSAKKRKRKALDLLKKVGLKEHAHKKPNQLSGGQMQRVAIARALANNPDIILADEPTGALDTKTSTQIMDLIKEISREKLVIMVTHNPDLALEYATRVVKMKDGEITDDTNPIEKVETKEKFKLKKTSMNFLTALKLSFNNIRTKKGRTALTAFASSIGIIGIALILSLSNGFKIEVDTFEQNSLAQSPIMITKEATSLDEKTLKKITDNKLEKYPKEKKVYALDDIRNTIMHTNNFTEEYLDYLDKIDKTKISGITYARATNLNIIRKDDDKYFKIEMPEADPYQSMQLWSLLPENPNKDEKGVIELNYDVLAGNLDYKTPGLILQLDNKNQISKTNDFTIAPKDLSLAEYINDMIDIGITSFKIEGRMRSIYYVSTVLLVYRNLIDMHCNNVDDKEYTKRVLKILYRCANREVSAQFYNKKPDDTDQYYSGRKEDSNQDFLGVVLDYDEDKKEAIIEQRNYFKPGDKVTIFSSKHDDYSYVIKTLKDEDDNIIDAARHPRQIVKINCEYKVYKNDLIRVNFLD